MKEKKTKIGLKCLVCGAEIFSEHRHDMTGCDCPSGSDTKIFIDGGDEYSKVSTGSEAKYLMIERGGDKMAGYRELLEEEREQERERIKRLEKVAELLRKTLAAAEEFIHLSPCDPDIYEDQLAAWEDYTNCCDELEKFEREERKPLTNS